MLIAEADDLNARLPLHLVCQGKRVVSIHGRRLCIEESFMIDSQIAGIYIHDLELVLMEIRDELRLIRLQGEPQQIDETTTDDEDKD